MTDDAQPWVFWYWMHGAVSGDGITADLEAMKENGIGGAYIFAIKDTNSTFKYQDHVRQLSPEWWKMVQFAFSEAGRLGLDIAFNVCDGFATAGGPWITPELSMQKIVWADTVISGKQQFDYRLPQPEKIMDYYRDIAVCAFPAPDGADISVHPPVPVVSTNLPDVDVQFLAEKGNTRTFVTKERCWIQYAFGEPFTCRSVVITCGWQNYQANRLIMEVSNDGTHFTRHCRLEPYRHGWQEIGVNATHRTDPVTARYFRFVYDPEGTEPGAEDLDNAKWEPELKISGITLSGVTRINQFEGKTGAAWRIAKRNTGNELPVTTCIDPGKMTDLTRLMDSTGQLTWDVPEGKWMILRMGHTTKGQDNTTGGGGRGLECDKLNPEAVKLQFDSWFEEAFRKGGKEAEKVVKLFHVDSWECGSQNWSPVFREEFRKRRGYDILPFMPVMAGIPVKDAEFSEKVLYDIRLTLSEVVADNFYKVLAERAHQKNCWFSAECTAPVFSGDGILHYRETDLPMGEFWLRSPSHDKPNDILDAVSGGHIYGRNIIQAEGFTEIRLDWDEHPAMLKPLADLNFANGINRMVYHVFTLNPWLDRKPGMTLDRIGTFLQRDQTWWKPGRAFTEYLTRCQVLLQQGRPVTDIAVFTGEEIPSRAVLPDRLTGILPGIMGQERVKSEKSRLRNEGLPVRDLPGGVSTLENMADPGEWIDPLRGYQYDSFNKDALLNLAKVEKGKIVLPGGASYRLLVVPGTMKMNPEGKRMSVEAAQKLLDLVRQGATILVMEKPEAVYGWQNDPEGERRLKKIADELFPESESSDNKYDSCNIRTFGKGRIIHGPCLFSDFTFLGFERDFFAVDQNGHVAGQLAWTHRKDKNKDIYFISNQKQDTVKLTLSFRISGKLPEIHDPVTGAGYPSRQWKMENGRTYLDYQFYPGESVFIRFDRTTDISIKNDGVNRMELHPVTDIRGVWSVKFDPASGGPHKLVTFPGLTDWSLSENDSIRYYSGTAVYSINFSWQRQQMVNKPAWLELEKVFNMAEVSVNGHLCGICWTPPYRVKISEFLQDGDNKLEIAVSNTWHNRIIRDHGLPPAAQVTWTTAPYRLAGKPLLPAGITGYVRISEEL